MKHILPFIVALALGLSLSAQPVTTPEIAGTYQISKMYINDTLFYDIADPAKSNKNILTEISKNIPIDFHPTQPPGTAFVHDTTIAIYLFYKDIYKALHTVFTFEPGGILVSKCSIKNPVDIDLAIDLSQHWEFNEKTQVLTIKTKGNPRERYPVNREDGKVIITIEDKKEGTKVEIQKK